MESSAVNTSIWSLLSVTYYCSDFHPSRTNVGSSETRASLEGAMQNSSKGKGVWAFFILIAFGSSLKILGILQKESLWGILCTRINFVEKISFIFHFFHLKMRIIWLKWHKVKSVESKWENKIGRESSIFYSPRKGFNNEGILCIFHQKGRLWLRFVPDIRQVCIKFWRLMLDP